MVFVYVPHRSRRDRIQPTPEEERMVARLQARGLAGDDLAAALASEGVQPERARQLAFLNSPRDPRALLLAVGGSLLVMGFALALGASERPLRHWLREAHPGWEWVAGMLVPILLLAVVLWKLAARRLRDRDAPDSPTRADRIDNRPIG
jgi:hypothetical protein